MDKLKEILDKHFVFENSNGTVCFIREHQMAAAIKEAYNKGVTEKNKKIDSLLSYCKKAYEKTSAPEKVMNNVNEQYYAGVSETYNIIIDKLKEILKEENLTP